MGGQTALPGLQRWRADLEDMRCKPFAQVKESLVCVYPSQYGVTFLH